ncbi:DNA cytosine methyltransferase [Streptomyces triticiradicis]|uniref:Cytosine-specific methyltransferase n=1 Tax=Streptomyces triticiradicis TaxID=2651189 RepID=A0A7J5D9I8_9ACTN|nr:DNA cytosine methyltransferase [Streptomyces triticiradicis]KAB1983428.1 DNA cytosine methyltransferase [Streptomyces triticiradicis]
MSKTDGGPRRSGEKRPQPTAIDLFSGAGGASLGLVHAGFDLRLAVELHPMYGETHAANLPGQFLAADLKELDAEKIANTAGVGVEELDVLFAGPPCQGFSMLGSRVVWDERNNLFKEVLRVGSALKPKAIVIENVPGLVTLANGAYLRAILEGLKEIGYEASCAELLAAAYGAPQMRWRLIIIAWRKDLGIPHGYGFPQPSHGSSPIGRLLPNCSILPEELEGFVNTREALGDLPAIQAGEHTDVYSGVPETEYQKKMRHGLTTELHNHYAAALSAVNLERLALLKPGQDWRDLPHELLPAGMQRAKRKDHTRRYRRMTWNGIPRSVVTRFRDPKTGEYTHPEQNRTISIREAARLQGFPDSFIFHGTRSSQYEQVGNAVPVPLADAIAAEVKRCLSGELGTRLDKPFSRRPVPQIGIRGELIEQAMLQF